MVQQFSSPEQATSYIGGLFTTHQGKHSIPVVDPTTEDAFANLYEADAQEVSQAIAAARQAFEDGRWSGLPTVKRQEVLLRIQALIKENAEELAQIECRSTGIPISQLRERQLVGASSYFQVYAELAGAVRGEVLTHNPQFRTLVTREPVGVAALISPWNSPLYLSCSKIAAAIAFGNTCVLKPSEYTPFSLMRLMPLLREAGVPAGVVNLVNGRGSVTGAALVEHPGIDLVSFTGGTHSGRLINAAAARNLKATTMELGGKSANIILETADLDRALDAALVGIYSTNGQQCLAGSRILLQRSIADKFISDFVARARKIRVGNPFDEATEMGPLANRSHYERVLSYVDVARQDGDVLLTGGRRAEGFSKGYFFEPTAVLASTNRSRVCQEEIFGPFATFIVFDTLDEAIQIANDSDFGLVSYLWTEDFPSVMKVTSQVKAGTVCVNTPMAGDPRTPFGGFKDSGVGREGGQGALNFFTELKTTLLPVSPVPVRRIGV